MSSEDIASEESSVPAEETLNESDVVTLDNKLQGFYGMLKTENVWGHDENGIKAIQAAMAMLSTKTGIYARIPIYCKGEGCPYEESCPLQKYDITPVGQACPVEIAQIQKKYVAYAKDFDLESENASETDRNLVAEIIKMEIYMERCDALMSKEGSPIQMVVTGIADNGTPIESPDVSKSVLAYERFSKKRNDDYALLMATRKDKKKDTTEKEQSMMDIMKKAVEAENFFTIDQRPEYIPGVDDVDEVK